jgi:hypothetical protein
VGGQSTGRRKSKGNSGDGHELLKSLARKQPSCGKVLPKNNNSENNETDDSWWGFKFTKTKADDVAREAESGEQASSEDDDARDGEKELNSSDSDEVADEEHGGRKYGGSGDRASASWMSVGSILDTLGWGGEDGQNGSDERAHRASKDGWCEGVHWVSLSSGEGLMDVKQHVLKAMRKQETFDEQMPSKYLILEQLVLRARARHHPPVLEWSQFAHDFAGPCGMSGDVQMLWRATRALHTWGVVHFDPHMGSVAVPGTTQQGGDASTDGDSYGSEQVAGGEEVLMQGMVILDPEWLAEALRCIITWTQGFVQSRGGLVDEQLLRIIWSDSTRYPEWLHGWLMQLLVHFELAYPATDQQKGSLQSTQGRNEKSKNNTSGQKQQPQHTLQEEPVSPTSPLSPSLSQLAQEGATAQLIRRESLRAQHSPVQPLTKTRLESAEAQSTTAASINPKDGSSDERMGTGWVYVVPALLPEEEPDMAADHTPSTTSAENTSGDGSKPDRQPFLYLPGLWDPVSEFVKHGDNSEHIVLGSEYRFRGSIPPGFVSRLLVRLQQLRQLEAEAAEAAARTMSGADDGKPAKIDRLASNATSRTAIQCWRTGALVHYDGKLFAIYPPISTCCLYIDHRALIRLRKAFAPPVPASSAAPASPPSSSDSRSPLPQRVDGRGTGKDGKKAATVQFLEVWVQGVCPANLLHLLNAAIQKLLQWYRGLCVDVFALRCVRQQHGCQEVSPQGDAGSSDGSDQGDATLATSALHFNSQAKSMLAPLAFPILVPPQPASAAGEGSRDNVIKVSGSNERRANVQVLRFSIGALKCLARAGVTQIVNLQHPSAFKSYIQKQKEQRSGDEGCEAGSRLDRLKGPLSVDTSLNAHGGSRDNSPAYTPSVEVQVLASSGYVIYSIYVCSVLPQESSANVRNLLSRFGSFLSKIDDELATEDAADTTDGHVPGQDEQEGGGEGDEPQDSKVGADTEAEAAEPEGGRMGWSMAELLTAVEIEGGAISSADSTLHSLLRKGKKGYDESLLLYLEEVLTQTGPSDVRHRHLLQVSFPHLQHQSCT